MQHLSAEDGRTPGRVITFYSYKGGTGRTMALANVGCLLAEKKLRVLMIDWDLEAPGLHRYLYHPRPDVPVDQPHAKELEHREGLLELFEWFADFLGKAGTTETNLELLAEEAVRTLPLERFVMPTKLFETLSIIKAGRFDDDSYASRVARFDWQELHSRAPSLFRCLASRLAEEYDYILIDSRTGLTDVAGICTMLMPERLVLVFTPNLQSLRGLVPMVGPIVRNRRDDGDDLRPLMIYPLASRIDRQEPREEWRLGSTALEIDGYQPLFENALKEAYRLPKCDLNDYFDEVSVIHVPAFAYGEPIASIIEVRRGSQTLSGAYKAFSTWLTESPSPWQKDQTAVPEDLVASSVEAAYASLSDAEKQQARRAILRLVRVTPQFSLDRFQLVSLPVSRLDLSPQLLDTLRARQIVETTTEGDATFVRLSSKVFKTWSRLRDDWLKTEHTFLDKRQELDLALEKWERDSTKTPAIANELLNTALRWKSGRRDDLTTAEIAVIDAAARERRKYRLGGGIGLAIAAGMIAVFAYKDYQSKQQTTDFAIVAAAKSAADPLDAALLLAELPASPVDTQTLNLGRRIASNPLPRLVIGTGRSRLEDTQVSPDGKLIASANAAGLVQIWDVSKGSLVSSFGARARRIAWSPNSQRLLLLTRDGSMQLVTLGVTSRVKTIRQRDSLVAVSFTPDGYGLVGVEASGYVRLYDDSAFVRTRSANVGPVLDAAFSADGNHLAVVSPKGAVERYDWSPNQTPFVKGGPFYPTIAAKAVVYSRRGRDMATWSLAGRVEHLELVRKAGTSFAVASVPVVLAASDSGFAAVGDSTGTILLMWENSRTNLVNVGTAVSSIGIAPDETTVVAGYADGTMRVWSPQTDGLDAAPWDSVVAVIKRKTSACLTAPLRVVALREDSSTAARKFTSCERDQGRGPPPSAAAK
jgi:cellulose biosynthesis protein BcsQ